MIDGLRKSEYTGENRCWPCTVLNTSILLLACAGVTRLLSGSRSRRFGVASVLGVVGGAGIALRGYLVPGTPQFAPKLVSALSPTPQPLQPPAEPGSLAGESDEETGERALSELLDAGVVHAVGESLQLDERFRTDWRAEMESVREGDLEAAVRAASSSSVSVQSVDSGAYIVVSAGGVETERWLSRPVAIADVAAVRTLAEFDIDRDVRVQSASALRAFCRDCPVCDTPLEETSADSCCGSGSSTPLDAPDDVLACPECDQRVFTF
ncbi:hypothetical protein ZOD2009_04902 [Haladaptatus paucihalophilus DX253]|uniref:Uncharacterized protein n=1 Tax=Haladaptatus paucihalophilus DX253 TaxID=797209 RepID=E7QQB0_HALPU|nr:hypothetical protein [Haladaptatus paucihalophilus]EFW93174.1 hypothetical protein ZOD2009_04902 [Haladaptatus paucihalophilus DX253]SHK46985.1 hypothetical protein SAMN05444342_1364 [Haladaptatus paucihalophilus DX253]